MAHKRPRALWNGDCKHSLNLATARNSYVLTHSVLFATVSLRCTNYAVVQLPMLCTILTYIEVILQAVDFLHNILHNHCLQQFATIHDCKNANVLVARLMMWNLYCVTDVGLMFSWCVQCCNCDKFQCRSDSCEANLHPQSILPGKMDSLVGLLCYQRRNRGCI